MHAPTSSAATHPGLALTHAPACLQLVLFGARVDVRDELGRTPLQLCLEQGKRKVALFLMSRGASINTQGGPWGRAVGWVGGRVVQAPSWHALRHQ